MIWLQTLRKKMKWTTHLIPTKKTIITCLTQRPSICPSSQRSHKKLRFFKNPKILKCQLKLSLIQRIPKQKWQQRDNHQIHKHAIKMLQRLQLLLRSSLWHSLLLKSNIPGQQVVGQGTHPSPKDLYLSQSSHYLAQLRRKLQRLRTPRSKKW